MRVVFEVLLKVAVGTNVADNFAFAGSEYETFRADAGSNCSGHHSIIRYEGGDLLLIGLCRRARVAVLVLTLCSLLSPLPAQIAASAATPAPAQGAQPAIQVAESGSRAQTKSPADLYKEAMHPLDVVRGSLDNWSDTELGALAVGMHKAGEDCAKLKPTDFKGDDLYELARLCTFGQGWNEANRQRWTMWRAGQEHRAQAYALSVNALVHLNATDLAVKTAHEMLFRLPYDAEVAYALRGLKEFLEESSTPTAAVAADEHPMIVAALAQGVPLKATHGDAEMSVGALYESAMQLAFLDRYDGDKLNADSAAADVKNALPATAVLTAEDRMLIDSVSTRYQLLGTRLPEVKVMRSLQTDGARKGSAKSQAVKAEIGPHFGAATVLVLFPDWCVLCRRMMKTLTEFATVNRETPIHAYGLVFADDSVVLGQAAHDANLKEMRGTQTLVVPAATAQSFGASDFPLGIVLDRTGTIRFIDAIPGTAFNGDSYIGKVIVRMVRAAGGTLKNPEKAK